MVFLLWAGSGGLAGSHHGTSKVILRKHGIDPAKEVTLKFVSPGERSPTLLSNSVDGVLMDYSEALRARKLGLKLLLNADDYRSPARAGIGASQTTLRDRRDRTIKVMARFLKTDKEIAKRVYQPAVENLTTGGFLDVAGLKTLGDDQLAGTNPKDDPCPKCSISAYGDRSSRKSSDRITSFAQTRRLI